jgi:signal recognition particle receptor subunit beta
MPLVNHGRSEIHVKVVYYGPGLGGKTTNLEHIHRRTRPDYRGKLISLMTESERTLFFDLLPMELGSFRGYRVRLHLCTVPGQIAQDRTRQLVLRHVDGIVFVVDSQAGRMEDNIASIHNLDLNLRLQGDDPTVLPLVIQYNKRDLPDALPTHELRRALGVPEGITEIEASAVRGVGVFETLKAITKSCLALVGDPRAAKEGRSPSVLPGKRASLFPGGRPAVLDQGHTHEESHVVVTVPGAPRVPRIKDD